MKLLYAEDEIALSMAVTEILKMEQFEVDSVYNGNDALSHIEKNHYDTVILDIMMPQKSGIEVVEQMRASGDFTPVLLLTAKNETEDRIHGLSCGADDYLGKPFAMGELLARIQALLRRTNQYKETTLTFGNITLNCENNELNSPHGSLRLSNKESQLLAFFLKHPLIAHTCEELLQALWGKEEKYTTLTLYISYLQNKLKQIHAQCTISYLHNSYILQER